MEQHSTPINAMPTKAFFVTMLVRDISPERAILDLVDNCIDGAKRTRPNGDYEGLHVSILIDNKTLEISDNCGGFDTTTAREYAFRFGRPAAADQTDFSIGQFGVGMKRALFKFGRKFSVSSKTTHENWSMSVDVAEWANETTPWSFEFSDISLGQDNKIADCGTKIVCSPLTKDIDQRFGDPLFQQRLAQMLRSHQRQFLSQGLKISLNETFLTNTNIAILSGGNYTPAVEEFTLEQDTDAPLSVRIVAGIGTSNPSEAGWYIICNGRVILSADRSEATGWGSVAEQTDGIPKFHNQYARFRGVVLFVCKDSRKLPWNTAKTGLDQSNAGWQLTYTKMLDHARSVMNYLNALDDDIEEWGRASSPMLASVTRETVMKEAETYTTKSAFAVNRNPTAPGPKMLKIQYSKEETKVRQLMTALGATSGKAVGEETFDIVFKEQIGE